MQFVVGLHLLLHLIFMKTHEAGMIIPFSGKKIKILKLSNLSKVTQLIHDRSGI